MALRRRSLVWVAFVLLAAQAEPQAAEHQLRLDEVRTLSGQGSTAECVAISPDGKRLASAGIHRVVIWAIDSGEQQVTIEEPDRWFMGVAFSPDGKTIAATGSGRKVAIYDAATGAVVRALSEIPEREPPGLLPAPTEPVPLTDYVKAVSFSPDGKTLATGDSDGRVALWDIEAGKKKATFVGHEDCICDIAYSFDGRRLATGSHDGTARLWDAMKTVAENEPLHTLRAEQGDAVVVLALSPDGARVFSASEYATIDEWDAQTGNRLRGMRGHGGRIVALAISPDGTRLATSSITDETMRMWDVGTGTSIGVQRGLQDDHIPYTIAFSPCDATVLATGARDGLVRLWRFQGSEPVVVEKPVDGQPFVLRQEIGDDHVLMPPWQTFTAPLDGVITQVDLRPNFYGGAKGTFLIREEAIDGSVLHEQAYEAESPQAGLTWHAFVLPTPVPVQKGKQYTWVLNGAHGLKHAKSDVYPGGAAGGQRNRDYCFRIHFKP